MLRRLEPSEFSESSLNDMEAVLRVTESFFPGEIEVEISVDEEYPERPSVVFHVTNSDNISIHEVLDRELKWQNEVGRILPDSRDRLRLFVE